MRKWCLPAVIALVAGCAKSQVKQAENPFANDRQGSLSRKMSLALVLPTLEAVKNGKPLEVPALNQKNQEDPETMYREVLGAFYQNFKRVTLVKSLNDPRVADADVVGTLGMHLTAHPPKLVLTSSFFNPDHGLAASIRTEAASPAPLFPARPEKSFAALLVQIPDLLDKQIRESADLKQYAKSIEAKLNGQVQIIRQKAKVVDSDVDRPGYSFEDKASNYAVVIGVESYQSLPSASFAGRDAHAVRAHLRALGYPSQNIVMLTDSQATGNAIRSYVESWLPRNVREDSKVLFYFSGHGAPDSDSKQAYLVPWDADSQFLSDTGYPVKRLYQKLNGLKAKQVIVAMDSCFSGAGGHSVLAKGARPLMARVDAGSSTDMGKIVVLAAAGAEEITGEEENQGHGLFTYYFLKGLNESAGKHNVGQIYGYLKPKVEEAARQSNRGQTPQLLGATDQGGSEGMR